MSRWTFLKYEREKRKNGELPVCRWDHLQNLMRQPQLVLQKQDSLEKGTRSEARKTVKESGKLHTQWVNPAHTKKPKERQTLLDIFWIFNAWTCAVGPLMLGVCFETTFDKLHFHANLFLCASTHSSQLLSYLFPTLVVFWFIFELLRLTAPEKLKNFSEFSIFRRMRDEISEKEMSETKIIIACGIEIE